MTSIEGIMNYMEIKIKIEIELELKIELKLELKIQIKRTELPKASLSCFVIFYYRLKPF